MKRVLAAVVMAGLSALANADQPVASVGFAQLSDSGLALTGVYVTGGYQFQTNRPDVSITPEVRLGFGIIDDNYAGVNVKLDSLSGVDVRAQLESGSAYFYVAPSYTRADFSASFGTVSASGGSWESGIGFGAGFKLSADLSVEASWENFSGTDIYSVGLRHRFKR